MRTLLPVLCILSFVVALIAGCRSGTPVEDIDVSVLLPLAPGTSWWYAATQIAADSTTQEGTLHLTIAGIDTIGREAYARLAAEWSGGVDGQDGSYGFFRNTDEGLVRLTPDAGFMFVYRFPLRSGTRYSMPSRTGLRSEVVVGRAAVRVPAGRFDAYVYAVDEPITGSYTEYFAPGVGLVKVERGPLTLELERTDAP